jgi:hypothetical protein
MSNDIANENDKLKDEIVALRDLLREIKEDYDSSLLNDRQWVIQAKIMHVLDDGDIDGVAASAARRNE